MSLQADMTTNRSAFEWALWRNRALLALVSLHLLGGIVVSAVFDVAFWSGTLPILLNILKTLGLFGAICLLLWRFGYGVLIEKPRKPIQWLLTDLRATVLNPDKMLDGMVCFLSIGLMAATFTALKDMIPLLRPFAWDPTFAALDRAVHGGVDPWRLLWPVFGTPFATALLNAAYHLWFALLYVMVFVACFDRRTPDRGMVFLLAFALTWIVGGNLLATVFSSVGPVYFEAFGYGADFTRQMQGLQDLDKIRALPALDVQEMLLENYRANGPIRGISAMPSMHVATSVVMALFAFGYNRWLGWVMTGFAAVILIGSVHLAWHYAIDGYAAILLALLLWPLAKRLTRWVGPST